MPNKEIVWINAEEMIGTERSYDSGWKALYQGLQHPTDEGYHVQPQSQPPVWNQQGHSSVKSFLKIVQI